MGLGERVRTLRAGRGLTQRQLAELAGVSRQLIGAVEAGRHLPRVDAAAALARSLGTTVEELLGTDTPEGGAVGVLASPPDGALVRVARVGEQRVCVPVRPVGESLPAADAVVHDGLVELFEPERGAAVVAGCDPALGLIARLLEQSGGTRALAVPTSSVVAAEVLTRGRAHAAVVHGRAGELSHPDAPARRWRVARWRVGLAAAAERPAGWDAAALAGRVPVVQREPGAGSQAAFERAVTRTGATAPTDVPGPRAGGHVEAAWRAATDGLVAVTIEPSALALGLSFRDLEEHVCELWVGADHVDVPEVRRFLEVLTGRRLRRRLEATGGYDLAELGTEVAA